MLLLANLLLLVLLAEPTTEPKAIVDVRVKYGGLVLPRNIVINGPGGRRIQQPPIVGPNRQVIGAVVHRAHTSIEPSKPDAARRDAVTIAFDGLMIEPNVVAVNTGQPIKVVNKDNETHTFHSFPQKQRPHNFEVRPARSEEISCSRSEFIKVKCDVHPWESGYVAVFDHSDFAVTDGAGFAQLQLSAGTHSIRAWHSELGEMEYDIALTSEQIKAKEPIIATLTFKDKKPT